MSKKYKGKTCAYCGVPGISSTPDHVLARQFVPEKHRANLPQVPACKRCNTEKARLEHHLTAVLPIGARYVDEEEVRREVPRRLARNAPLARSVASTIEPRWLPSPSGLLVKTGFVFVDEPALLPWASMVVKGLVAYHWGTIVESGREVIATLKSADEAAFYERMLTTKGVAIPLTSLGNGAFTYTALGVDGHLPASIWRLSIYDVELGGADPRYRTDRIYIVVDREAAHLDDRAHP